MENMTNEARVNDDPPYMTIINNFKKEQDHKNNALMNLYRLAALASYTLHARLEDGEVSASLGIDSEWIQRTLDTAHSIIKQMGIEPDIKKVVDQWQSTATSA